MLMTIQTEVKLNNYMYAIHVIQLLDSSTLSFLQAKCISPVQDEL